MITLENYRSILGDYKTVGRVHKAQSDMIMDKTWNTDITAQVGYFYDWDSDTHIRQYNNMNPLADDYKIPIDVKHFASGSQSFAKDAITFHIQFRPHQSSDVVPYYKEKFIDRYSASFPVGLYVDLMDSEDVYNRWLCVGLANSNDPQFTTYEVLRCDKVLNYIFEGKKYFVPIVTRSRNSYSSGIWSSNRGGVTIPEDQTEFIMPLNRETEKVYYNQRFIIDVDNLLTEPRVWRVSRVNRINSKGVTIVTLSQDKFNPNADYLDESNLWWADWYDQMGAPTVINDNEPIENIYGVITCAGSQTIKVRGSYKKLKITYYNNEQEIETINGTWHFYYNGADASSLVSISTSGVETNEIKIKFLGEGEYIGKELTIKYIPIMGDIVEFKLPIVSL